MEESGVTINDHEKKEESLSQVLTNIENRLKEPGTDVLYSEAQFVDHLDRAIKLRFGINVENDVSDLSEEDQEKFEKCMDTLKSLLENYIGVYFGESDVTYSDIHAFFFIFVFNLFNTLIAYIPLKYNKDFIDHKLKNQISKILHHLFNGSNDDLEDVIIDFISSDHSIQAETVIQFIENDFVYIDYNTLQTYLNKVFDVSNSSNMLYLRTQIMELNSE